MNETETVVITGASAGLGRAIAVELSNNRKAEEGSCHMGMTKTFKRGDHVEWNSEAGRVRGVILKKVVSDAPFKDYVHHASKDEPQYIIKSEKTDHIAMHKGKALKLVSSRTRTKRRAQGHTKKS